MHLKLLHKIVILNVCYNVNYVLSIFFCYVKQPLKEEFYSIFDGMKLFKLEPLYKCFD